MEPAKSIMQKKILALFLRGVSMGAKFLLLIGLSKELTLEDYGVFSLIVTTITFFIFLIGADFYNFSHREIIDNEGNSAQFMGNQFWFHTIGYVLFIPIIYLIFAVGTIPFEYLIPFYLLLILEHLAQESFRFFNLFNKPNLANFTLFLRTAGWIIIMVGIEYIWLGNPLDIRTILWYWIGGSLSSFLLGLGYILLNFRAGFFSWPKIRVNWPWIRKGIYISFPFFLGTIAYKVIEYSDRYMIDWLLGKESVGIYSFFTNVANIVNIVVNTITITLIVPNLLRNIREGNTDKINNTINKFKRELIYTTLIVSSILIVFIYQVLSWVNNVVFNDQIIIFFIILGANVILNISLYYHFLLYAYKQDKNILIPALWAALLNVILNVLFIPLFGIIASAISTLGSFALIFYYKRKYWKNHNFI